MKRRKQSGYTFTELMIASALGISVVGSVLIGYLATYSSAVDTLAAAKLNRDMASVMNLMMTELRRAGYSGNEDAAKNPAKNPFNQPDDTALEVYGNMADSVQLKPAGDGTWTDTVGETPVATEGTCIVYAYDFDDDGMVESVELGGFRLRNHAVQLRTSGYIQNPDTCSSANNTWESLTDSQFMRVTQLTFNLDGSTCLNIREPDGVNNDAGEDSFIDEADEADCYDTFPVPGSGDITLETILIEITLTANLRSDPYVVSTQSMVVRVRNEQVRVR